MYAQDNWDERPCFQLEKHNHGEMFRHASKVLAAARNQTVTYFKNAVGEDRSNDERRMAKATRSDYTLRCGGRGFAPRGRPHKG